MFRAQVKLKPETLEELSLTEFKWSNDTWFWDDISFWQVLAESFMEKYADKVDWHFISCNQVLSELFIEKYSDKLDWPSVSLFQNLSLESEFKLRVFD